MDKKRRNKIIAIIPARGGSKGVPRKNIKTLCGKPLTYYSIKAGLESKYIDRVVVSTEDNEIEEIAKRYEAEVVKRPMALSRDYTPSLEVFQQVLHFLKKTEEYIPDIVVILQPTSPLRKTNDIDTCIEKLCSERCDSVITVTKVEHPPQWMVKLDKNSRLNNFLTGKNVVRRQESEELYIPNGAVFVTWVYTIIKENTIRGADTRAIVMPSERSIDIDTELDFYIAEQLMIKNERNKSCR